VIVSDVVTLSDACEPELTLVVDAEALALALLYSEAEEVVAWLSEVGLSLWSS
jgi:hypothetical protein